jgi:hypothetical protein
MAERATPAAIAGLLSAAAIVGFVVGGVLGSLTGLGDGDTEADAAAGDPADLVRADVTVVSASCERPPAVDTARNPVEYKPEFAANGDLDSAWQCRGDGVGETLELSLGDGAPVVSVGLLPGYTKVDPHDDTEWYPLNRRLTEVLWHFDDGTTVSQQLDPDPDRRDLQAMELPAPVETSRIVLEIVSSAPGSSDAHPNVAISDLQILVATPVVAGQ